MRVDKKPENARTSVSSMMSGRFGNAISDIVIFLGDIFPLFIIISIIYWKTPLFYITFGVTLVATFCILYWYSLLNSSKKERTARNVKSLDIKNSEDSSTLVIGYFLTYTISIPSVAIIGGSQGLAVLLIVLVLIYLVFKASKIMVFNPFLSLFDYKVYRIETREDSIGYLIVRSIGQEFKPAGKILAMQIDDFTYIFKSAVPS